MTRFFSRHLLTVPLVLVVVLNLFWPVIVYSQSYRDYCPEPKTLDECITELTLKITATQNTSKTLAGEISYFDSQIVLANLKIAQTSQLITSITNKIDTLENRLRDRTKVLETQIVQIYKQGTLDPFQVLFSSTDFSTFISQIKYSQLLQSQNRRFLYDTQMVQSNYAQQKTLIEDSQKKLQTQKASLSTLRESKNNLLRQTKNDEATYQRLLAQAVAEREAMRSFTKGGTLLPPQPSPDGWYYNQRDQRWGMVCIGSTCSFRNPSYVWEVGCLITSVTMLRKKNGDNITPADLARNSSFFFEDLMLRPFPAQSGYQFTTYDTPRTDVIGRELDAGRPVIVGLIVRSAQGGRHFVVLKSRSGGSYIMNDPWFGPDLNFSDHYSVGNILNVTTYTPS